MSRITTHVLDTTLGKPAAGIAVRLNKENGGGWVEVNASVTDADGRCRDLTESAPAGRYRLTFHVDAYFKHLHRTSLYSEISIVFACSGNEHYHLPLLLSDNGYTTYRGS